MAAISFKCGLDHCLKMCYLDKQLSCFYQTVNSLQKNDSKSLVHELFLVDATVDLDINMKHTS